MNFENEKRSYDYWLNRINHWWDINPAYDESLNRGWCLYRGDSLDIIGFIGSIPTFFQVNNEKQIVYSATTWRVEEKYRKQSLLLFSKLIKQSRDTILFDTTPTEGVIKILSSFRFNIFPNPNTENYLYIINFNSFFKNYLSSNKYILLLAKPILKALILYQRLITDELNISEKTTQIFSAGREFDSLWNKTKNTYKNTNIRNSAAINWQCFTKTDSRSILFGYTERGILRGYAVYSSLINGNMKMLVLSDIWGFELDNIILKDFYGMAQEYGKRNNYDVILYNSFNRQQNKLLNQIGFFKRKKYDQRFYKSNLRLEGKGTYLSLLQGDYSL